MTTNTKLSVACTDKGLPIGIYFNQFQAVKFITELNEKDEETNGYHVRYISLENLGQSIRGELELSAYDCYVGAVTNIFQAIATSYKTPKPDTNNLLLNALFYLIGAIGNGDLFTKDYVEFMVREREA